MEKKWHYLINTFLILANRSLKRFYKFMFLFMEALSSQSAVPGIAAIYAEMDVPYQAFRNGFITKKSKKSIKSGDVKAQKLLFDSLYQTDMPEWHRNLVIIFEPGTVEYKKIFTQGLTPLSQGSMEEKLSYFKTIIETMKLYTALDEIRGEMETACTAIDAARSTRVQAGTNADISSADLKLLATELAVVAFGALGSLIHLYMRNPDMVVKYISVSLLRYHQKPEEEEAAVYEMLLAASETKAAEFVFTLDEELLLYNSGETTLKFWFVKELGDAMPTSTFEMAPDAVKQFVINVYANADDRYLMVQNLSDTDEGSVEIEKL
jgi:hypothetical protein